MDVELLVDRVKRLMNMDEMMAQYASYPENQFMVASIVRHKMLVSHIRKIIDGDPEFSSIPEKICDCGKAERRGVIGSANVQEVFCPCKNRVIDYDII